MRWLVLTVFLLISSVAGAAGMGYDEARHLLNRTGFSASESEVQEYARLTRQQAVTKLLDGVRLEAQTPVPDSIGEGFQLSRLKDKTEEERKALLKEAVLQGINLRAWWYQEMLDTPSPLTEKMTLFWHNHFVSSQQKVKSPVLMYQQNVLLRKYALGNFGDLLHAISIDPAMIIYLDNVSNRKNQPNENFAREVMELFTLGEGGYSEQDVKEAARAFTGWSLDRDSGQFRNYLRLHDDGIKVVLGQSGRFDGDAVLDILLAQPRTAELITRKLWLEFISPIPDPLEVKRLAGVFRSSGYDIKALMRALLTSDAFYAKQNRATLVKSPVEFIIGTLQQFDIQPENMRPFLFVGRSLGQDVFGPPNVKGWPGGDSWINSNTLLIRKQFLERLMRDQEMRKESRAQLKAQNRNFMRGQQRLTAMYFDSDVWMAQFNDTDMQRQDQAERLLLAATPVNKLQPFNNNLEFIRQLVLDPAYQIK
ncbi:DUF1800 domain-containing protein [Sulfurirhabdus autotrophica]|uniref:Uncharacterized protein (DUF1800 family) n=1 Tax=Sulfurirhabdus autotrophica TaxID=1706046 RepID=A0A4R3Y1C5_9PROT|nr:DUF1800 domain-containing protein [Sulfurirhabdus autotrophica]TCV85915.1 uncharacterized protein (DUF1800 family) [Sulfurirhabdus autotrophica]